MALIGRTDGWWEDSQRGRRGLILRASAPSFYAWEADGSRRAAAVPPHTQNRRRKGFKEGTGRPDRGGSVCRDVSKPNVHDFVPRVDKKVCFFFFVRWGLSAGTRAKNGKIDEFETLY